MKTIWSSVFPHHAMKQHDWAQLIADIRGSDVDRAVKASETLSEFANETHAPELYTLLQDESFFVRELIAEPLARIEGVKALPALLEALTRGRQDGHDNDGLCAIIADLLEEHKQEVAPLLLGMLNDANEETRLNAAWSLGFVASEITPEPLLYILNNDGSPRVRSEVASTLGSFKSDNRVVEELLKLVQDSDRQIRIAAILSLGYLGDSRAIQPLRAVLKDPDETIHEYAHYALKQLKVL